MKIKYQRTSTNKQHGERFSVDENIYDLILFDKGISGTLPFKKRTEAQKMLPFVEEGKVNEVVIEEIRDVGRNMADTIATLKWLDDYHVNVIIRGMGNLASRIDGKKNPIWGIVSATLSSIYEMERENLLLRTAMGREAYVRKGGKLGRKKGTNENAQTFLAKEKSQKIISLLNKGKSTRDIAGRVGCSLNLVVKVRRMLDE